MSSQLPYNPTELERELRPFYLGTNEADIKAMLETIGVNKLEDLFAHLPPEVLFKSPSTMSEGLSYTELVQHVEEVANKNRPTTSFIGDGLQSFKVPDIVPYVCNIRGLTTAYTPYQPERSQGTLHTLWIYSQTIGMLTGFEGINASLYERSTCLFEAINTAKRMTKKKHTFLISEGIYPGDKEVLHTLEKETDLNLTALKLNQSTGLLDPKAVEEMILAHKDDLSAIIIPQVNTFGLLEDVHALTDLAHQYGVLVIAIINPLFNGQEGLVPPNQFGEKGADIIVGEGQPICLGPNFGGPGLGIFGVRYNAENKLGIRSTAGRYVGKGQDEKGNECLSMVLSTREQHIRREKATSNICSNQSFVATIAGAALLQKGDQGIGELNKKIRHHAQEMAKTLCQFDGIELAFPQAQFYNEITLEINKDVNQLIEMAREEGIHLGVNPSCRISGDRQLLKLSFSDLQERKDLDQLTKFFQRHFTLNPSHWEKRSIDPRFLRQDIVGIPQFSLEQLKSFYSELGGLNVSPDDNIYPLGSCTMKYNPYINDYAASLPGFTDIHPQAPLEDAQGCLHILYETQEMFKAITGLPGLTTQPVAGAQGELVGLKLFQAYHRDQGEGETRNIILIPKSAHGTNPATATMAGFETKTENGQKMGIVTIGADQQGQINWPEFEEAVNTYGQRIAGIMVTNPNTSGIFETRFHEMSKKIHEVGGLVYMDGANMNAIAGWVDLAALGVDAVHNNLHKTWTIPHGGGGPGDAIVAVSEKLIPYLPGIQVKKEEDGRYTTFKPEKSIGSFHRHFGNFAHKVRCYTYIKALGAEGVKQMSAIAVLSARYLFAKLKEEFPSLPSAAIDVPRMHEFILTICDEDFTHLQENGTAKSQAIAKIGKLFLDFGIHAPTVAFPEQFGLMIEPTESYSKEELDRFIEIIKGIKTVLKERPDIIATAPHFTPISKVDEVGANKNLNLFEGIKELPTLPKNPFSADAFNKMSVGDLLEKILSLN